LQQFGEQHGLITAKGKSGLKVRPFVATPATTEEGVTDRQENEHEIVNAANIFCETCLWVRTCGKTVENFSCEISAINS